MKKAALAAFPKTIPIMAGYLVIGIGFGLLLQSKGYSFWWAILMSLTIYGGSMQFVTIDLLTSGANLIAAALMTIMVQARHLFYGLSMLNKYRGTGSFKPYLIFGLTDETFSLVCTGEAPDGINPKCYYFCITLLNQIYWIIGSAIGGLFGQVIHIQTKGIDFAMTALFIVILTENLLHQDSRLPSLIGLGISLLCLFIFGADNFLIPAMLGISMALLLLQKKLKSKEASHD